MRIQHPSLFDKLSQKQVSNTVLDKQDNNKMIITLLAALGNTLESMEQVFFLLSTNVWVKQSSLGSEGTAALEMLYGHFKAINTLAKEIQGNKFLALAGNLLILIEHESFKSLAVFVTTLVNYYSTHSWDKHISAGEKISILSFLDEGLDNIDASLIRSMSEPRAVVFASILLMPFSDD